MASVAQADLRRPAGGGIVNRPYLLGLNPKKDPITFMTLGRCSGSWIDKDSKGCGHLVRINYMSARPRLLRRPRPLAKSACCPICGQQYIFAFYKLKEDRAYRPSPEEEADIRALYADLRRMAQDKDPEYEVSLEERVRLHCKGLTTKACSGEGHDPALPEAA